MKSIGWLIVLVLLLTVATQAEATPVLLGTLPWVGAGGHNHIPVAAAALALGLFCDGPGQPCLGCGIQWTDGQAGSVSFTPANTPSFSAFSSRITNGVEEQFVVSDSLIFETGGPTSF
jgi:hypothetical protein